MRGLILFLTREPGVWACVAAMAAFLLLMWIAAIRAAGSGYFALFVMYLVLMCLFVGAAGRVSSYLIF